MSESAELLLKRDREKEKQCGTEITKERKIERRTDVSATRTGIKEERGGPKITRENGGFDGDC